MSFKSFSTTQDASLKNPDGKKAPDTATAKTFTDTKVPDTKAAPAVPAAKS